MFEAQLKEASLLKKIIESIRETVVDANLDCSPTGIYLQAMDANHVSLCTLNLKSEGFDRYRCDRNITIGINIANLSKILKCAGNNDIVILKAEDSSETLVITFESQSQERISEFELKLITLESEHLQIPESEYSAQIQMPSVEFQRIVRDLSLIGDVCKISCVKDKISFSVSGDLGSGSIVILQNTSVKEEECVDIKVQDRTELSFALRYLNHFTKATSLGPRVTLSLEDQVPLVVEYSIELIGNVQFYLAPKVDDDRDEVKNED